MLRKQVWQIVNQTPLNTIPINDKTNPFPNSCCEFAEI